MNERKEHEKTIFVKCFDLCGDTKATFSHLSLDNFYLKSHFLNWFFEFLLKF